MSRRATRIVQLTAEWIDAATPIVREEWHDTKCQGLVVRISPTGSKVFYWVGRVKGRQARLKIGAYPKVSVGAARAEAKRLNGEAAVGRDLTTAARTARDEMTLGELNEWYLENHAKPHKRTWRDDQRRFERQLSHWANRKIASIQPADVQSLHVKLGEADGPYAANKMLELLGHEFRMGRRLLNLQTEDPTRGIVRFATTARDRFLTQDEIPRFLEAVEQLPTPLMRDYLKMCLFTGARRSNVAAMRWDEIDIVTGTWLIPAAKFKTNVSTRVVLPEAALDILARRRQSAQSAFVFATHSSTGHIVEPKHALKQVLQTAGLTNVRLHDLRRTLGSWMAAGGTSLVVIGKTLGHTSPKSTAIYARLDLDPVRAAVEAATTAMTAKPQKKEKKSKLS